MSTGLIHTILDSAYEKSKAKPKRKNNKLIFRLPKIFGVVGWIGFTPGLLVLIYGLVNYNKDNFGSQLGIFGILSGTGFYSHCFVSDNACRDFEKRDNQNIDDWNKEIH